MRKPLALTLLLALPPVLCAAQFNDVPRSHWAYSAIGKLVDAGMIQGKKGNFQGHKAFTRYEMAVVLARYLERMTSSQGNLGASLEKTYPLVKRLTNEFREELEILGVRHQEVLARVTSLETRADMHQRELMELRTLIQENRRYLASAGVQAPPVGPSVTERHRQLAASAPAPRPVQAYRPAVAPSPSPSAPSQPQYQGAPASYGQQSHQYQAPQPRYQAPQRPQYRAPNPPAYRAPQAPQQGQGQQYASPIPVPAPTQRYAPQAPAGYAPQAPSGYANAGNTEVAGQGRDAARLHRLRMRARGLLAGGLSRSKPGRSNSRVKQASHRPARRQASAPQFGLDLSSAPTMREDSGHQGPSYGQPQAPQSRVSTASILDTIDQVRSGKLDPVSADRFAGGVERAMGSSPLHQRLFGSMGFGPPASD